LLIINLVFNFFEGEHLFQDHQAEEGIEGVDTGEEHENDLHLTHGIDDHRDGHPHLVAL